MGDLILHVHATVDIRVTFEGNTHVGDVLDAATYERLSHIAPMLGRPRSPTMEELLLQAQGVKRRIRVITSDFYSMATALVGTNLVATMHTRLALACARRPPIRVLPLPYDLPTNAELPMAPFSFNAIETARLVT